MAEVAAQRQVFSTHDWTPSQLYFPDGYYNPFVETWADVKTPGGRPRFDQADGGLIPDKRRTYCVGTIEVNTTRDVPTLYPGGFVLPAAQFSGSPVGVGGLSNYRFSMPNVTQRRQVVIVQCNRTDRGTKGAGLPDPNGIVWQQYFYGQTGAPELLNYTRATNARAISVWEAEDAEDARIAICGESWDERMPLSQGGGIAAGVGGYVAVFDGFGTLKWTHHFFSPNAPTGRTAVTDLAIRRDASGNDIVTYCGVTTIGDPGLGSSMSPKHPFAAPAAGLTTGSTVQPPGQWDGFVGRLFRAPAATSATTVFHSIVGGPGQDGLFGLAEISPDRFVVVGSTESTPSGTTPLEFPLAELGVALLSPPYQVGAALVFDASAVSQTTPGNLSLVFGAALGRAEPGLATIARDVDVGFEVTMATSSGPAVAPAIYIVGSTNDAAFRPTQSFLSVDPQSNQPTFRVRPDPLDGGTFGGAVDGFIAVYREGPTLTLWPHTFRYWGGPESDSLHGVNGWNEFSEHVAVVGARVSDPLQRADIGVSTYLFDNAFGPGVLPGTTATPNDSQRLRVMRETLVGGTFDDRPAVMGLANITDATTGSVQHGAFLTFQLGQAAAGGGVSVANDGRVTAVGRTLPTNGNYPVAGLQARGPDEGADAVRTDLDMVPQSVSGAGQAAGVSRTDGTGWPAGFPIAGYSGGTTPACGLGNFGRRVGEPLPPLARMLIDYEGLPPAVGVKDAALVVSRPAAVPGSLAIGVLWVGFPTLVGPTAVVDGVEFWADPATWVLLLDPWPSARAYRVPMAAFPPTGGVSLSMQLHCLLDPTPGAGSFLFTPVTHAPGCVSEFVASPALWFGF
jgi:hypothetical protein